MAQTGKPVLGVWLGNTAGIGSELVAKVAAKGFLAEHGCPVIIGDNRSLRLGMKIANVDFPYEIATDIREAVELAKKGGIVLYDTKSLGGGEVKQGVVSPEYGKEEGDALARIIRWCREGVFEGFCYAPLNKGSMKAGGYDFSSEYDLFAHYYELTNYYSEMNVFDGIWNVRVTGHIPLKDVCTAVTEERIINSTLLGQETLRRAGIAEPRFAMASINPHCGDNGTCGREEIEIQEPVLKKLQARGVDIRGPFAPDTVFISAFKGEFDGVVTMYHDQGQIAIKLKGFEHTVSISAGMPHPITTPSHGTAFDIVGKGVAITSTFEDAYKLCCTMIATDRAKKA